MRNEPSISVETHSMNLLPFDSSIANLAVVTFYSMLVGGAANITLAIGFSCFDRSKSRRR